MYVQVFWILIPLQIKKMRDTSRPGTLNGAQPSCTASTSAATTSALEAEPCGSEVLPQTELILIPQEALVRAEPVAQSPGNEKDSVFSELQASSSPGSPPNAFLWLRWDLEEGAEICSGHEPRWGSAFCLQVEQDCVQSGPGPGLQACWPGPDSQLWRGG